MSIREFVERATRPINYSGVARADAFILVNMESRDKGKKFAIKAIDPEIRNVKLYAWAVRVMALCYERRFKGFELRGVMLEPIDSLAEISNGSPVFVEFGSYYKLYSVEEALESELEGQMFKAVKEAK